MVSLMVYVILPLIMFRNGNFVSRIYKFRISVIESYSGNTILIVIIKFMNPCLSIFVLVNNLTYDAGMATTSVVIVVGASQERNYRKHSGHNKKQLFHSCNKFGCRPSTNATINVRF